MASADLVILGGGSGGYACALRASELGMSVILIDKDKLGGTCLHRGCIPTKALLHAAEVADSARESDAFGVRATFEGIDMPKVNEYRDGVVGRALLESSVLTVNELFQQLREKGIRHLGEVRHAYLEADGSLSVFRSVSIGAQR